MELKNTIAAMVDSNYKARFAAECCTTEKEAAELAFRLTM